MRQLTIKNFENFKIKYIDDLNHSQWYVFNKFRHDCTNYNDLTREYNRNNCYMDLVIQFVTLCSEYLPHNRFKDLSMGFYDEKLKMNS